MHLSVVEMLFKEITETVLPKVLRTILNLGGSDLICLWRAFKERDPAAKVTKQKAVWSSYWKKEHATRMLMVHGLAFPLFV